MSTTDLFVEILIIGVGAATWLALLVFSIFGYTWIDLDILSSWITMIPSVAIIYVLGIVIDRIADRIFDCWKPFLQRNFFSSRSEEFDDRRYIYVHSERLVALLEYGRSRLRICRGWAFNAVLILISADMFMIRQVSGNDWLTLLIFSNVVLLLLISGLVYSWYQLTWTDYRKVESQSAYLRSLHGEKGVIPKDNI